MPPGCAFEPRCNKRTDRCADHKPSLESMTDSKTGHTRTSACFELANLIIQGQRPSGGSEPAQL